MRNPICSSAASPFLHATLGLLLLAMATGCAGTTDAEDAGTSSLDDGGAVEVEAVRVVLENEGGTMEGHTPRGFQGQGTGLFAGDNLNANFPDGDGVQMLLSFDVTDVPEGEILAARLFSEHASTSGTPFDDLGELTVEEIEYDAFSSALYDLVPVVDGHSCVFGTSSPGPHECDIAPIVARAISEGRTYAQVRIRFDLAGDSDGQQDLAMFFITDSNTNEPGIFEIDLDVASD